MECGGPKVATNALAIPSPVVSMKPFKLFGPGARKRADDEADHDDPNNVRHDDLPVAFS